jgi:trehalose 6-phosphate phosphatase
MRAGPPPPADNGWAYFLDVDGTLIAIADTPDAVHVDRALLRLLGQLYQECGGAVALISGRAIRDLEGHLGVPHLPVAGQHGLERRDAAGRVHARAAPAAARAGMVRELSALAARHPGLLLEDKGITLALHYRLAPGLASYVQRAVAQLVREAGAGLEVQRGKRVAEIKPAGFDKGSAVLEYLAEPPFLGRRPVYIGDDLNDEHAFAEVNRLGGISIRVGRGGSSARFRLPDVDAVRRWLGGALKGKPCAI